MKTRIAILVLLALGVWGQIKLASQRPNSGPILTDGVFAALGGFRSIAAEVIWFRADRLYDEGRYVELAQLAHALTLTEPHTPEVWAYSAWNLAYNVSVMMDSDSDRWRWVLSAISLLRDEALKYNPKSADIYKELAWLFELKIGINIDSAAPIYRAKWRELVEDVAQRNAWVELAMDPNMMQVVEKSYGITDRTDPMYSAIYWAHLGSFYATPKEQLYLNEIIRQSRKLYEKSHLGPRNG